jgi:sugar transferase EpsL
MIKLTIDILVSLLGITILSPFLSLIGMMISLTVGSPIIFKQLRPGLHDKPFTFYKFRTMTEEKDSDDELLSDEARLTKFGRLLRKTSIDELPSLWNVLKGDMSIVGPRPLLMEYLPLYSKEQARRHEVKPGITGWAQINGRNVLSWEEKFEYDVWYVDNRTLLLDTKIILLTIWKVLKRDGINQSGHVTMEKFTGDK